MDDLLERTLRELLSNPEGIAKPDGVLVGYARVSTADQKLDLQLDALKREGVAPADIFVEKISGAAKKRPELERALRALRPGDTLVVWRLDRVARSLRELLERLDWLEKRKIAFRSISERNMIDTGTAAGRLILHVLGAMAEFERQLTRERTGAGMRARKLRGGSVGAPRQIDVEKARDAFRRGLTFRDAADEQGCKPQALRRYITTTEAMALRAMGPKRSKAKK